MGVALAFRARFNLWVFTGSVAGAVILATWFTMPDRFREWFRWRAGSISWGIASGIAFAAVTHIGTMLALGLDARVGPMISDLYGAVNFPPGPVAAFPVVILVAGMEEIVWRGVAFDLLESQGIRLAAVLSVILYTLPPIASLSIPLVAAGLICGVLWTALRLWRGDLWAPLVSHIVWNGLIFALWPLSV